MIDAEFHGFFQREIAGLDPEAARGVLETSGRTLERLMATDLCSGIEVVFLLYPRWSITMI